jgi:hypothetical protein
MVETADGLWGSVNPYAHQVVSAQNCFFCGAELIDHQSDEHVFPRWLLRKHSLWNNEITLSNGTSIPYRKLTVPCCGECNTRYLSQLESRVGDVFRDGADAVRALPPADLFVWVSKINYGVTYKECFLQFDQSKPDSNPILNPDYVRALKTFHGFMQAIRLPIKFLEPYPWSMFVFKTHTYPGERDFDWHGTPWKQLTLTIRSHGVGVIATLMDNGEQRQLVGEEFDKLAEIPLHPIQFDELSAMCVYQSSLLDRSSAKYMSVGLAKGGTIEVISMPLAGNSTKPLFRDWDLEGYARLLEFYWHQYGATFADIYRGKGRVLTKVSRASGDFPIMDSEGNVTGTRKVWKKFTSLASFMQRG